jgi:hypothetical protein
MRVILRPVLIASSRQRCSNCRRAFYRRPASSTAHGLMYLTGKTGCLGGWSAYFSHGTRVPAYRAIDAHVYDRVR